ncbi:FAD-binding oxidoreductase [Rhodopseudomonas sp. HC1]|uniref:NAD(P)/FAD-dependent oxidoreductase n=1 Tax=Rhodopseudomonas infernalis TaxID=2897386 RepID=UPI001EE978CE|nr:FAD-binding oxidoreductase [Rhodopseudomonas infernalis]MCG6204127.1 FAD-binding oxidoreductase [Rhodopseudomonas infernalis]
MSESYDFAVVGGGICGVAAACELAVYGRVVLVEREQQLAYHTTGRSAAISMESYGNAVIRKLTTWSTAFYKDADHDFFEHPAWSSRGALILSDAANQDHLIRRIDSIRQLVSTVQQVDEHTVRELAPYLAPGRWTTALYEPHAFDLDVHAIHFAYLKSLRRRGGTVLRDLAFTGAVRQGAGWTVSLSDGSRLGAGVIVNAAGAWADEVAQRSGIDPCGIKPLRRTVVLVDTAERHPHTPYIGTVDERIFIKPEATGLMVSPCDETLSAPCDAAPDELDIAIAMDRFESMTTFGRSTIRRKWAGLRTFVADRTPIVGREGQDAGFVWSAAVGGYGIQAAPAIAKLAAAAALGVPFPEDVCGAAIRPSDLSPQRCRAMAGAEHSLGAVAELT